MKITTLALMVLLHLSRAEAQTAIDWQPFTFTTPAGVVVAAERGTLDVPERRSRPGRRRIRLALLRLPATSSEPGPPIIWLAGGPGSSGIQTVIGNSYPMFASLRAHGDVIALDQRGTGQTTPSLVLPGRLDLPPEEPVDAAAARARMVAVADAIRSSMASAGIDLSAYSTRESADDVDAVRQALGVERVVLVAHSYGTHLALAVIKRHGSHVSKAVLAGVNGLGDRWRDPLALDAWLARVDDAFQHGAVGRDASELTTRLRRVLARLTREPERVIVGGAPVRLGASEVQALIALRSGDLEFVHDLPALIDALERRENLPRITAAVQQVLRQRPIGTAMTYAMHVASGVSAERRRQFDINARRSLFGDAINLGIGDPAFAAALGVADLGESFRAPFTSDVPVLIMSATLDGRTSEDDARAAGRQFANPVYVTLDGASHDFPFRQATAVLIRPIIARFLDGKPITTQRLQVPPTFRTRYTP
jgi:pimeloyl-ACP methyl ester carboxylesterase